jgi:quercetin dioxygenase-like cupin family protein
MVRIIHASPRVSLLIALVLAGSVCIMLSAQQQGTPVQANFTGTVRSLDASNVRAVRFQYDAGARSYWHTHDGAQILFLEQGHGRMQLQGQPVQELVPGQPVVLAGGVPHWHGAAPDQGLTQIAVNVGGVKWMQAVSDQEYLAPFRR